jgi:hypothetical protein
MHFSETQPTTATNTAVTKASEPSSAYSRVRQNRRYVIHGSILLVCSKCWFVIPHLNYRIIFKANCTCLEEVEVDARDRRTPIGVRFRSKSSLLPVGGEELVRLSVECLHPELDIERKVLLRKPALELHEVEK